MKTNSFGFAAPEESPGFLLWQTTVSWQRLIKSVLEPFKISHAQFVVLALLLWLEESSNEALQSIIIEKSKLDKMTVCKALKKLSMEGLVLRAEHPVDTRAKLVTSTRKGRALTKKLVKLVENADKQFFATLSKKSDMPHLLQCLTALSS
jgi:DNA-binding MarR family transcriptional regulator